jgi:benzylsuccinate CoA-transferase BbsF subunit
MDQRLLNDVRAISMGSAWAGPYVGRVLAELGAEVFRIEFPERPQVRRGRPDMLEVRNKKLLAEGLSEEEVKRTAKPSPNYIGNYQAGNYGIGLDLRTDKGKEIYKRLAMMTDIVVDGWSPRVMSGFGLGYSELQKIKPDIIYLSLPAMGMSGQEKDVRMYGTAIEYVSGLTSIRGYPGGEPHRAAGFILDGISSAYMLTALFAALNYRDESGKGQHIDLSQAECGTSIMGEAIMDYAMNKRVPKPIGNRPPFYAPYGCYRCKGDDMWVTIAVTSDEEWRCLCDAIGKPEWTKESRFADMLRRCQNRDELDKLIEEWTLKHDHYAVQEILQEAGVPAAAVATLEEHILYDPQVKDRDIYTWLTFHDGVADPIFRVPWVLSRTSTRLDSCGPYTGLHNDYLLKDLLKIPEEEVAKLYEEKVVGTVPP